MGLSRRRFRRSLLRSGAALPLVCALLLVGGCGGESDKEKLASDVNDICSDLENSLEGLESANSLRQIGRQGKKLIPEVDRATTRLARVKASGDVKKDLGDDYTKFVATFRATAIAYGALVGAAERNDQRSVQTLVGQLDQLDRQGDMQAKKLGFDDCASDQS
jgi:hypothetical protein